MAKKIKLASFDLDGTLTPVDTLGFVIKKLRPTFFDKYQMLEDAIHSDTIQYDKGLREQLQLISGLSVSEIESVIKDLPLLRNSREALMLLKEKGIKILLLTDNPDVFCLPLLKHLPIDHILSSKTIIEGDIVKGISFALSDKAKALTNFIGNLDIPLDSIVHIGDWKNDIPVFKIVGFSIALNPREKIVSENAKATIRTNDMMIVARKIIEFDSYI